MLELAKRHHQRNLTHGSVLGVAKRAIANEQQRASSLMPTLSSIASASPFIGLFGTVWGIMDAFLRIGVEKSASLPVVAPAIGEALIATAFGLVAAIPATIGFNYVDKRIGDLLEELTASAEAWVALMLAESARTPAHVMPLVRESARPTARAEAVAHGHPGRARAARVSRHQRHAAGRRDAGAADRVHGHGAASDDRACASTCPR